MKQTEVRKVLTSRYPSISLMAGDTFYWSPVDKVVYYKHDNETDEGAWALLHESGHALLDHTQYYSDIELVLMEVEAWEKAKEIVEKINFVRGARYGVRKKPQSPNSLPLTSHLSPITIDEDHIQDCLDSYRDWLHKRSLCPDCHLSGVQITNNTYSCIFCQKKWRVSSKRFCRPYRKSL